MIYYSVVNIVETLLRVVPVPCRTGLYTIGNPDRNAPVFLTGNYHLTVERVKKALKGMDCYLLVANSKGINVWCAATGGYLTNHTVISILKTSGIEDKVDHRTVILPQLAAPGVEAARIKKTGWKVVWGPVYAKDIPEFVKNGKKTEKMRRVTFSFTERMEMAALWAFPASLLLGVIMVVLQETVVPVVLLVWALSVLVYTVFPVYEPWLAKSIGGVPFGLGGFQLLVVGLSLISLYSYRILTEMPGGLLQWGIVCAVALILSFDIMGSTPVYKSGLHGERVFTISLDEKKCKKVRVCKEVCPKTCFDVPVTTKDCVKCGACIVQCPFDALSFKNAQGDVVSPETIRKYKVNLMGSRSKD